MREKISRLPVLFFSGLILVAMCAQAQNSSPYWSLSGNNNATINSRLGTTNYTPLNLKTNNLTRIYIGADGKIGIGTTSPASSLTVEGQTLISTFTSTDAPGPLSGSGLIGYLKGSPTQTGQRLGYFLLGSQGGGANPYNAVGMAGYSEDGWTNSSHPAYLTLEITKTGTTKRVEGMRINSKGQVGIGTTNPYERLHVVDSGLAILGEGLGPEGEGIYGSGGITGVRGLGDRYGLYGEGSGTGASEGVYGDGFYGVHGMSSQSSGSAVIGEASAMYGSGGYFWSKMSDGLYARTDNATAFAAHFDGDTYSTGTYTGSDKRLKKDILDFSDAVDIIRKLKPKTYAFQTDGMMAEMNLPSGRHYGLIAQDLEAVLPDLVKETTQYAPHDSASKNVRSAKSNTGQTFKAVNYTELIPILIKAAQEQDSTLAAVKAENTSLKVRLQILEAAVEKLTNTPLKTAGGSVSSASLEVPVPNPATGSTNIRYNIPAGTASARLTVVNMLGQVMKEVKLTGGSGQVNLNISSLASGTYPCTLWVNGQQAVSRQLVIAH